MFGRQIVLTNLESSVEFKVKKKGGCVGEIVSNFRSDK